MSSVYSKVQEAVFSLPIIDTHSHVRQYTSVEQPMTALRFFNSSSCLRQYLVAAGTMSRAEFRAGKTFDDWPALSVALDQVKATAYYRILLKGLSELYSIDLDELDEASFHDLNQVMSAAYQDPTWYNEVVRERSNIEVICQDTRMGEMDRSLFAPVARVDYYVYFGRKGWREKVTAIHGEECSASLQCLVGAMRQDFDSALAAGAVAIKSNDTWGRRICYEDVSEAAAEDALALCNSGEAEEDHPRILGDYIMHRICELCAEHDIALQMHTGPAGGIDHFVDYGNPTHLNSLFILHPETRFVVFHAGGPFWPECRHLAVQCQNVHLDLCGVIGVHSLRAILEDWIEHVPHTKIMWGTDVNVIDETFAMSQSFRRVLTGFLADRVESGYFSLATAQDFARAIFAENARRVLRWDSTSARQ